MSRSGLLGGVFLLAVACGLTAGATAVAPAIVTPLPPARPPDPQRVALGSALFGDSRLSAHGRISCRSCHDVARNGASPAAHDWGDDRTATRFNTPTVFNAALNFRLSWEGRFRTMPDMVASLLDNPHIMGGAAPGLDRLGHDPAIAGQVRAIYGHPLDRAALTDALASYLATLTTPGARFDRYLAGDAKALSPAEVRGWARFRAVGCASCHQGVNIGGNLYQRHGIFHPLASPDPARLRVPSLRNVATTPPYFHDGSAPDLAHAIRAMARAQLDLSLSDRDVADIAAFLRTLTGSWQGRPVRAPDR